MKVLKDILYKVTINAVVGSTSIDVAKIEFDSRQIEDEDVVIAQCIFTSECTSATAPAARISF